MSKLSKRAISTLVIAILLISTIAAILPISYADHTSSATVAFTAGESAFPGDVSSLDVVVTNVGPDPISTVVIDFSGTTFTLVGEGTEPTGWIGVEALGVITYTGGTIASSASVTFVPVVTNPLVEGLVVPNPTVTTSDAVGHAATLTTGTASTDEIDYVADTPGVAGNSITIAYIDPLAINIPLSVDVPAAQDIEVTLATDGAGVITSTADLVVAAINVHVGASALVDASTVETGLMATMVATPLTGGIDPPITDSALAIGALTIVPPTGTLSISTTPIMGTADIEGAGYIATPYDTVLPVGTYTVTFEVIALWDTPDPVEAVVTKGETTDVLGTYTIVPTDEFSIEHVLPLGDVVYDMVLTVIGGGVTSGNVVDVYWDYVTAAGKLNTTTGLRSGNFECEITVPSADYGDHYIWAVDAASGTPTKSRPIRVIPMIELSPSSGLEGDDITMKGYGFSVDSDIDIDLGLLSDDAKEAIDDETDDLGYFEYTFDVKDLVSYGSYTVYAYDPVAPTAQATFTVGAAITLDKKVGPTGTIVKVEGRGFTEDYTLVTEVDITLDGITPVSTKDGEDIITSGTGKFTAYVVIPSVETGDYLITIDGGSLKVATAKFEVDGETKIKVSPGYGTPGTVLTVKGYNFTRISGTDVELVLWEQSAEATTDASGSFTATIVIPPCDLGVRYDVIATDERLCTDSAEVLVTIIFLQLSEYSAPVGTAVTLMGSGFTANDDYNATIGDIDLIETTDIVGDITYFSHIWWVPSLPTGPYTINVRDINEEIVVGIDFTVTDPAALSVSRAAIPNGYNLTIEGVNFAEDLDIKDTDVFKTIWWIYNSTDAWLIDDNVTQGEDVFPSDAPITDDDGEFTAWYVIPKFLALGSYTINCTTVSNDPSGEDWEITQYAEVDIEIVPEEIVINIGSPSYARGQTITFVIKTTLKKEPFHLGIKDPEGSEYFNSTWLKGDEAWKTLGSWFYIPSNLQVDKNTAWLYTLPVDATPGTWTYSFWDDDKEYANGTFQVTQLTELEQLQQDIGGLVDDVEGIGTSVDDLAETVAGVSGASAEAVAAAAAAAAAAANAQTAAEAATAAVENVGDIASDALDAANNAVSAADAAKAAADAGLDAANAAQATSQAAADAAQDAADAAEANQRSTSGLTTLVYGAIGASLIAALAAIVSLMQISRRIAG